MKRFVLRDKEVAYYKKIANNAGFRYIKIELEGELGRSDEREYCPYCDGDAYITCENCDGAGTTEELDDETNEYYEATCDDCDNTGRVDCGDCDDGYAYGGQQDEEYCEDFIKEYVSPEARQALVYGNFYNDGSVDSEFTFTLAVNDLEYAVEYVNAFNALANEIGNGIDTENAGMHMAFLNSATGNYPSGNHLDGRKLANFERSVTKLLPALYFLGSASNASRGLGYRRPKISSDKYSAINYGNDVLEYRVFETCYNRPEQILDNFIVMARTLRFYSDTYIEPNIKFKGTIPILDGRDGVERFACTIENLNVLEQALRELRPTYKTLEQLNAERRFSVDRKKLREQLDERRKLAKREYEKRRKEMPLRKKAIEARAKARWYEYAVDSGTESAVNFLGSMQTYVSDYVAREMRSYVEYARNHYRSVMATGYEDCEQLTY